MCVAVWDRVSRCVLMFEDVITLFHKVSDTEWKRTVIHGVQWSEHTEKTVDSNGVVNVARTVTITFPKGTYEDIVLDASNEEDCIVYGEIAFDVQDVKGSRISDLRKQFSRSGAIKSVNDNSNRRFLQNVKVVLF